jgi:hypothetical protein
MLHTNTVDFKLATHDEYLAHLAYRLSVTTYDILIFDYDTPSLHTIAYCSKLGVSLFDYPYTLDIMTSVYLQNSLQTRRLFGQDIDMYNSMHLFDLAVKYADKMGYNLINVGASTRDVLMHPSVMHYGDKKFRMIGEKSNPFRKSTPIHYVHSELDVSVYPDDLNLFNGLDIMCAIIELREWNYSFGVTNDPLSLGAIYLQRLGDVQLKGNRSVENLYGYGLYDNTRRRLVMAPSGSGKTTYVRRQGFPCIDLDTIIKWPKMLRWWEDEGESKRMHDIIINTITEWLSVEGPEIGFYAVEEELLPFVDVFVAINDDELMRNLDSRKGGFQPGIESFDWIVESRNKILQSYEGDVASNFDDIYDILFPSFDVDFMFYPTYTDPYSDELKECRYNFFVHRDFVDFGLHFKVDGVWYTFVDLYPDPVITVPNQRLSRELHHISRFVKENGTFPNLKGFEYQDLLSTYFHDVPRLGVLTYSESNFNVDVVIKAVEGYLDMNNDGSVYVTPCEGGMLLADYDSTSDQLLDLYHVSKNKHICKIKPIDEYIDFKVSDDHYMFSSFFLSRDSTSTLVYNKFMRDCNVCNKYVFNYPNTSILQAYKISNEITVDGEYFTKGKRRNKHADQWKILSELGARKSTVSNWMAHLAEDVFLNCAIPFSTSSATTGLWTLYFNSPTRKKFLSNLSAVSDKQKKFSNILRRVHFNPKNELFKFRMQAVAQYASREFPCVRKTLNSRDRYAVIYFRVREDIKYYYLAVSGHLMGMIIGFCVSNLDLDTYLDDIEYNIKGLNEIGKDHHLETNNGLWHVYADHYFAYKAALLWMDHNRIYYDSRILRKKVLLRLQHFAKKYRGQYNPASFTGFKRAFDMKTASPLKYFPI